MIFSEKEIAIIKTLLEYEKSRMEFFWEQGARSDVLLDYRNTLWGIEVKLEENGKEITI